MLPCSNILEKTPFHPTKVNILENQFTITLIIKKGILQSDNTLNRITESTSTLINNIFTKILMMLTFQIFFTLTSVIIFQYSLYFLPKHLLRIIINSLLIISCKKKYKLYKQWLLNKSIKSVEKYKLYKNKLTHFLRIIEKEYYNNRFSAVKSDLRCTWKEIKSVIHENNNF